MDRLLEILGRGITVDTADLIYHWLTVVAEQKDQGDANREQLNSIVKLIGEQKIETAQGQVNLYLFENPNCPRGRLTSALINLKNADVQATVKDLRVVFEFQPNNTIALYALGHCYERLGQEEKAIEFYQDCIKFKSYLQLPRQRLAAIYFRNFQLEKTLEQYECLRDEYPDDISTLVTLGYLYNNLGKYDKAVEIFNIAILMHPDNFLDADDDATEQLIIQGQLHQAVEKIDLLLDKYPEKAELAVKKADVLCMLGDIDEAVEQYEKAVNMCPDFLEATIKLGAQYLRMNRKKAAAGQFNRAMDINDRIADAYMGLAIAQKHSGSTDEALSTLSLAAAIQPNSSLLFAETAMLQLEDRMYGDDEISVGTLGDNPQLIELVINAHRQQIAEQPGNADLFYRLGILMMSVNRMTEAIKNFQTALEIIPSFHRARSKMAVCFFDTADNEQALQQLTDNSDRIDRKSLELHHKVALLYCDRIKFASSLINLEHYMTENLAGTSAAVVNISVVLENLGLLDRVTAMWDNLSDTASHALHQTGNEDKY